MNNYLIPANSKKGQLIFNIFRWVDLIILIIGAFITVMLLFIIPGDTIWILFLKLLPIGLCLLLVLPIPYRHNVLVFLQSVLSFLFVEQKQFIWKGWCASDGVVEQQGK